jgi:hypothetical protein
MRLAHVLMASRFNASRAAKLLDFYAILTRRPSVMQCAITGAQNDRPAPGSAHPMPGHSRTQIDNVDLQAA